MESIKKIGMIIPEISDPLDYELLRGIHEGAKKLGYDVIVYSGVINPTDNKLDDLHISGLQSIYSLACRQKLDGLIVAIGRFQSQRLRSDVRKQMAGLQCPCILLETEQPSYPSVYPRQEEAVFHLTSHLIEKHHCRKLYFITGIPEDRNSGERTAGFRRAMEKHGISCQEEDIIYGYFWKDVPRQVGKEIAGGMRAMPDGIVCASDYMASELIAALIANGVHVPDDIKVTGYDGGMASWMRYPRVTTFSNRELQFGEDAVLRLHSLITGKPASFSGVQQTIRYGESCGCGGHCTYAESVENLAVEQFYSRAINRTIQKKEFYFTDLNDRLQKASTLNEWIHEVDNMTYMLAHYDKFQLCLCENWCMDFEYPDDKPTEYSDKMQLVLYKQGDDRNQEVAVFDTAEILPSLSIPHEPELIMMTALQFYGQIFGYIAASYDSADRIGLDDYYLNWCDAAVNGLAGVQNKLYLSYQKQKIESLTIHDPATGLLNRRGLAECLPNKLNEARSTGQKLLLILMSISSRAANSVLDADLLVGNALFHENAENVVCARLSDNIFSAMVMVGPARSDMDECETLVIRIQQHMNVLLGAVKEHLPSLTTHTYRLDTLSLSEAASCIRNGEEALTARRSAEENYFFNYKDQLIQLHREIWLAPQKQRNLDDVTAHIGISKSHFTRLYKELFGESFYDDLLNARLSSAKHLLTNTDLQIKAIAAQCGYQNGSHFMRQFKQRVGITALQYRKKRQK